MTTVFYTSDLHIGHRFCADLRGFVSTEDHDEELARNWDAVVTKKDTVWVCGDISAGGKAAQLGALAWLDERPGEKILVTGNHDGPHMMNRDFTKWMSHYLATFRAVVPFARRNIASRAVLLSHFPYFGRGEGSRQIEERYSQYRLPDMGAWLIHGHTHSEEKQDGKMLHVGVDAWGLVPVPQDMIAEMIERYDGTDSFEL